MDFGLIVMDPFSLDDHWEAIDQSRFGALYVIDHPSMASPDAWSMLAYIAGRTKRIQLGTHVTAAPFRHPTQLAAQVATVDLLSGGRARLGIGAGWTIADFEPFGYRYPPIRERLDLLEETIQAVKALWTGEKAVFEGKFVELRGGALEPKPIREPAPPVIVGLNTKGRAMRIAAAHAEEINTWQLGPDQVKALASAAAAACRAVDRDPKTLRVTSDVLFVRDGRRSDAEQLSGEIRELARTGGRGAAATEWDAGGVLYGDADALAEQAGAFQAAGVQELTISLSSFEDLAWFSEEVIPRLD